MTQDPTETQFANQFLEAVSIDNDLFSKIRKKAWERLVALGLPGSKDDTFQYMRLKNLFERRFDEAGRKEIDPAEVKCAVLPECAHSYLVFVDGVYQQELSDRTHLPREVVIEPFSKAYRTYSTLLQNNFTRTIQEEKNPFALLNLACFQDGVFIYVPPKVALQMPLQVIHFVTQKGCWMMPRLNLFQGAHSEMTLVSTIHWETDEADHFANAFFDFTLEENTHTTFLQCALSQSKVTAGTYFEHLRATLKRSSTLKTIQLADGRALMRRDSHVYLAGEGADASLNGISLLDQARESHVHVIIEHQAPHTRSMQLFKNVLNDSAHSAFQGKILVRKIAQKTEAYQLNNNLILSEKAVANSKPNLEIFADDVKASHGATMGQLDPEELFYLRSRGISKEEAPNMLIAGFCQALVELIPLESLRKEAGARILSYLNDK